MTREERARLEEVRERMRFWQPPTEERRIEIVKKAMGRGTNGEAVFDLDALLELYGPPSGGFPFKKDALMAYLRRAVSEKLPEEETKRLVTLR